MVGDDAVAELRLAFGLRTRQFDGRVDQRLEQVCVVIVVLALEDRRDAFQTHAGVDGRLGQVVLHDVPAFAERALILHEDEVPDFDEPVAILVRRSGRSARNVRAVIEEDLAARTAGPRVAHGPEIVIGRDADDAVFRQARNLAPQVVGLVVRVVDCDQQLVLGQAVFARHQFPCMVDGAFLEIVAEAEVAQHLEEGVMARRIADIVQIVVLAAGPDTFL